MSISASFGREYRRSHDECCRFLERAQDVGAVGSYRRELLAIGALSALGDSYARHGRIKVVADARIDARPELYDRLGLLRGGSISAAQLIAHSWARFGAECLDDLRGEFAFIVVDEASGTVHLARDYMGRRSLCYSVFGERLIAASLPSACAMEVGASAVDPRLLAAYLAFFPQYGPDSLFAGVERVEPGTIVTWRNGTVMVRRFWHPPRANRRISEQDAAAETKMLLDRAVRDCLKGQGGRTAFQLSGGMDSSAIAASIGEMGLDAIALTATASSAADPPPAGFLPEDGEIASRTAQCFPTIELRRCSAAPRPWPDLLESWNSRADQPLRNYENLGWMDATHKAAADAGASTLLVGDFGNISLSYDGTTLFTELLAQGRMVELFRRGHQFRRTTGASWRGIGSYALGPYLPERLWRAVTRSAPPLESLVSTSFLTPGHPVVSDLAALAREIGHDFSERPAKSAWSVRAKMVNWLDPGLINSAIRARSGITIADPTADQRLVEFTLSLPVEHWTWDGRTRGLARRLLDGRVPSDVTYPAGRGAQGLDWRASVEPALPALRAELTLLKGSAIGEIFDIERMDAMLINWPTDGWNNWTQATTYRSLLRAFSTAHFGRIRSHA